jgi:hypothetical protein
VPIDRANRPYDPQEARRRSEDAAAKPVWRPNLTPPPKPGVGLGLLLWTLAAAGITFFIIVLALVMYLRA